MIILTSLANNDLSISIIKYNKFYVNDISLRDMIYGFAV